MKAYKYELLMTALLDSYYFPRKQADQLCLIVDLENRFVYPVPTNIEHIDFVSLLKGEVKRDPSLAERVIPSNLRINVLERVVTGILTGVSGMESGYNVRHTREDIDLAHEEVKNFVNKGEIPFSSDFEDKKVYRYVLR